MGAWVIARPVRCIWPFLGYMRHVCAVGAMSLCSAARHRLGWSEGAIIMTCLFAGLLACKAFAYLDVHLYLPACGAGLNCLKTYYLHLQG